jgi:nucleoside-diphosphate-sugar epimerase
MRILVTGASGFIGRAFVAFLKSQSNVKILSLSRKPNSDPQIETLLVPEFSKAALQSALKVHTFDAVVHLAAAGVHPGDRDIEQLVAVNGILPGELAVLAVERGAKAMVMAGTSAEYRRPLDNVKLTEDAPLETRKLYGSTKASGGILAQAMGEACGLPISVLRIFNAYGAGEAAHRLLPSLIRALRAGEKVALSPGLQIRDFIAIHDVCQGFWMMLHSLLNDPANSGAYNLCTGVGISVADFARAVAKALGAPDSHLDFGAIAMRPDEIPYLVGDPAALRKVCNLPPPRTIHQGIAEALASFPGDAP